MGRSDETTFSMLLIVAVAVVAATAQAQQTTKIPRIGYLATASLSAFATRTEAFRQGLRELGYIEGKNILIEYRYADGKTDRVPALADELVRIKVDIIVTGGAPATLSAKDATRYDSHCDGKRCDPVGSGVVASLARPGGNITGFFNACYGHKRETTGASEGDRS